jgi:uncharacterized membrane protein YdjX (TVP38/TMEM64 family)
VTTQLKIYQKFKNREALIKVGLLFLSICLSTLIFINREKFGHLGGYGYVGIFILSILGNSTIIIPAPTFITTFVGGVILNPFAVGLVSALGASIGELTAYFAGFGGKVFIKEEKMYKKIEYWMHKRGSLTVFILAVIPNPFFDLAGIFSGLTNYSLKKFMLATFLGKSVKFILIAAVGAVVS